MKLGHNIHGDREVERTGVGTGHGDAVVIETYTAETTRQGTEMRGSNTVMETYTGRMPSTGGSSITSDHDKYIEDMMKGGDAGHGYCTESVE